MAVLELEAPLMKTEFQALPAPDRIRGSAISHLLRKSPL